MSKQSTNDALTATFDDCDAGWIRLRLTVDEYTLTLRLSHIFDPLPDILAWLEAIVIGVEECGFRLNEEGCFVHFSAHKQQFKSFNSCAGICLGVTPDYDVKPLQVTLPIHDLVRIFYRAFRDFAVSDAYVPEQWEHVLLEQAIHEQTGMTLAEWIDSVITLEHRQLQKALWRLCPAINMGSSYNLGNTGTEAELTELTGKTVAEVGGLPFYWDLPEYEALASTQERREYLKECLSEGMSSWSGTPWRKMSSLITEQWLDSGLTEPYNWKNWLIDDHKPKQTKK